MRKLKYAVGFLLALPAGQSLAQETWHLLPEPAFMRYESARPIAGAQRTVLVPARFVDGELRPLRRDEEHTPDAIRQEIQESAPQAASKVLAGLKPRFIRDENKVIQCAVLASESPLTASAVLAPEFGSLFSESMGPEILVAIPNRFKIFVFPKDSPAYRRFTDIVIAEYDSSAYPVSKELFSVRKGKIVAVGSYR